jgi:hypothetical protein
MFLSSWYMCINLSFLDAAVRCNNLLSCCSVSILPYVVGAQEIRFDVCFIVPYEVWCIIASVCCVIVCLLM